MIVKIVRTKRGDISPEARVRNLVNYIANPTDQDKNEKCHSIYVVNSLSNGNVENFLYECSAVSLLLKPRSQRLFDHHILSWPENETPSEKELEEIVHIWTGTLNPKGLAFSGLHVNTENLHLHFALQRFSPFGEIMLPDTHDGLYKLHALLYTIESRFGFAHSINPLVTVSENKAFWTYKVNRTPRDVFALRPLRPDLLPITPKMTLPFAKEGPYYYLYHEKYPCVYEADDKQVLLQWYRKEVADVIRALHVPVFNISRAQPEIALDTIPVPKPDPLPPATRKIRRDFLRGLSLAPRRDNQSAREERAVRYLFDCGYDEEAIRQCLLSFSHLEKDRLWQLRVMRILQSAKRAINRFRLMMLDARRSVRFRWKNQTSKMAYASMQMKKKRAASHKAQEAVSTSVAPQ